MTRTRRSCPSCSLGPRAANCSTMSMIARARPIRATRSKRCCRRWPRIRTSRRFRSSPIRWAISSRSKRCGRWRSAIVRCRPRSRTSCWRRPTSTSTCFAARSPKSKRRTRARRSPLFVSQDDRALAFRGASPATNRALAPSIPMSSPIARSSNMPMCTSSILPRSVPTTRTNHGKFAQSEVVKAIGARLAAGQTLNDGRQTLGESFGGIAEGAAATVGKAATLAVSAPVAIIDPSTRETLGDEAAALGTTAADAVRSPTNVVAH